MAQDNIEGDLAARKTENIKYMVLFFIFFLNGSLVLPGWAVADYGQHSGWGPGVMGWGGMGWFGPLGMFLFWTLIVLLIVWLVKGLWSSSERSTGAEKPMDGVPFVTQKPIVPGETLPDFKVRKGDRVRIRIGNPSSSTLFTIRIAGHPMTITHADGRPVLPFTVDALRIGMGERYDVIVSGDNPGVWIHHCHNLYHMEAGMANLAKIV